jgi:hypothetical protein
MVTPLEIESKSDNFKRHIWASYREHHQAPTFQLNLASSWLVGCQHPDF